MGDKKKRNKAKAKAKKKPGGDQSVALRYVRDWLLAATPSPPSPAAAAADFLPPNTEAPYAADRLVFELHAHSKHSDGFLSPSALVERAHAKGVKVLALTDHDTLGGIPEAMEAAHKFGMRIIPGVEISAVYSPRGILGSGEPVHILAYYGAFGPAKYDELDRLLSNIRDGRYLRAKNILQKLNKFKMPIKWEHIIKIAGDGVAPGRLHIARAMVEAGYVENLRQAFSKYLYDGGPAYATGNEPSAETVVKLICDTGGVSTLAHPWVLKNPVAVIRALKAAGLHALEVYRSDGKVAGFSELADMHELLKLGGSDFHGRGGQDESDLGSVGLPVVTLYNLLKTARPIWFRALKDMLLSFAGDPCDVNLEKIMKFRRPKTQQGDLPVNCGGDLVAMCSFLGLTNDEKEDVELEGIRLKLALKLMSR